MKQIILSLTMGLTTSFALAETAECWLKEVNLKTGAVVASTPSQDIVPGQTTTIKLDAKTKLVVVSAKTCAMDGGPCSKTERLDLTLTRDVYGASTEAYQAYTGIQLKVGNRVITAVCIPKVGG